MNIRHLVDKSFVPANKQTRVIFCRLTNLKSDQINWEKIKKHIIQTLRWPREAAKCSGVALSPSRKLISIPWSSTIHLMQLKQPICAAAWRGAMPSESRIKIVRTSCPALIQMHVKMLGQLLLKNSEETLTKGQLISKANF